MLIIATLMVPLSVILVPLYSWSSRSSGLLNTLWGVILPHGRDADRRVPAAAVHADHPRRADRRGAHGQGQSEWQIYWRIVLPLAAPALAVLAIFSVVWRWNDFLWPLIVLSRKRALHAAGRRSTPIPGELNVQWHFILAMTVVTMIPVVLVFIFLQRFITTGIAGTGLK